jgi:hypothetical protein
MPLVFSVLQRSAGTKLGTIFIQAKPGWHACRRANCTVPILDLHEIQMKYEHRPGPIPLHPQHTP